MSSRWTERVRHTLGFRLALWYAGLFLVSSLLLVGLTYLLLASSLRQRDHELIRGTLQRYAVAYERGGLDALTRAIRSDTVAGRNERLLVRVVGSGEEVIFVSTPGDAQAFDLSRLPRPASIDTPAWQEVTAPGDQATLEIASVLLDDGVLFQVGKSSESRDEILAHFRAVILLVLLAIVAAGLTGGAALTRWTLEPLRALIAAVRSILQTGRMESRVPTADTGDPLDQLTVLFNAMLDRIEALISGMRGSLDNVAHDLRTPMTRLRAIAERALQSGDERAYRDALADCLEESEHVVAMLDTLMDISEAETGAMKLQVESIDLAQLLHDSAELYSDLADEKGLHLEVQAPEGLTIAADRNRMRQVLANLADNAVKYTAPGGRILLEARDAGAEAEIVVTDTGAGIGPDDLPRIWDRLYRGDRSRSERGLGLGLSLVKAIVEAHKGRVEVASSPGRGSTFTLHLPKAGSPAAPSTAFL